MNETPEMTEYNELCGDYGDLLRAGEYAQCLHIVLTVQKYLDTLKHDTRMYRNGNKWTLARELMELNISRMIWLKKIT